MKAERIFETTLPDVGAELYNLAGQKLGRKGRDTRERIIAAFQDLMAEPGDLSLVTLSEIATRTGLRMGTLYLYFADLTELVLAALEPVMETAEASYINQLRHRWDEGTITDQSFRFVSSYHRFWLDNSRILHLRNMLSDRGDERMMIHRVRAAQPMMRLLVSQMDGNADDGDSPQVSMATALMTGLERVVTVTTEQKLPSPLQGRYHERREPLLRAEARLLELGIMDYRGLASAAS